MSEFTVHKITDRHPEPTKRILCLTEAAILERDPQTYSVSALMCCLAALLNFNLSYGECFIQHLITTGSHSTMCRYVR